MNVVPFLCRMALNLHQKRPSSVTSGWLFHRAIRREIVAPSSVLMAMVQGNYPCHPSFHRTIRHKIAVPSSVLMGDGAAKLPPSSAIPPRNTTRNCGAIIRFDGRWCSKVTPVIRYSTVYTTRNRSTIIRFDGRWRKEITPLGVILLIGQG